MVSVEFTAASLAPSIDSLTQPSGHLFIQQVLSAWYGAAVQLVLE